MENTVNRTEFVRQLIAKYNYTKKAAETLVNDFWSVLKDNLEDGKTVSFHGYGTFAPLERKEHKFKHPQNGDPVVSPAHWIPRFYPGTLLRRAVKIWEGSNKKDES